MMHLTDTSVRKLNTVQVLASKFQCLKIILSIYIHRVTLLPPPPPQKKILKINQINLPCFSFPLI